MSYLLDTCTISHLRMNLPQSVKEWFSSKDEELFYISVVTLVEVEDGIERLKPSKKKMDLEDWFYGNFQPSFQDRTLSIDPPIAKAWGQLNAKLSSRGIIIGVQDLYIAATAKVHGLAVVTTNTKDFEPTEIVVINPWKVLK